MKESDFKNIRWIDLRKSTRVNGIIGRLQCEWWCEDIEKILEGFKRKVVDWGEIQIDQYATSRLFHFFLQKEEKGTLFIADGTAGQFDPNYPEGYYGPLEDAPIKLKSIYLKPPVEFVEES